MFGEKLKELRLNANLTKTALAKKTGLTQPYITYLEANQREPGANTLCIISEFFGVTTDYLLGREDFENINGKILPVMDKETQELLKIFDILNKRQRESLLAYAEGMLKFEKEYKNKK